MGLVSDGTQLIKDVPLPPDLPHLTRIALDDSRKYGSETTFACGSLELPNPFIKSEGKIICAWMGNTFIDLLSDEDSVTIKGNFCDVDRWSSKVGIKGKLHIWSHSFPGIRQIIIFSDGFKEDNKKVVQCNNDELLGLAFRHLNRADSDDIAYLKLKLKTIPERITLVSPKIIA